MKNTSSNERKRQQDILRRIDQRLNALEERITALLSNIDFESMTSNQRVQASCRLLKLMMRLLELRPEYSEFHPDCSHAATMPCKQESGFESYSSVRPFSAYELAYLDAALKYVGLTQPVWSMLMWEQYHPNQEMIETNLMYWKFGLHKMTLPAVQ